MQFSPLPNILSASRILLSPLIFISVMSYDIPLIVFLAVIAILTDFLDGFLARKLKSISKTGKILDPLADKLCMAAAAVAATIYGELPALLLALILTRDIIIAIVGLIIIRRKNEVPVSNVWGKITVLVFSLVLVIYILRIGMFYVPAFWLAIIFLAISSLSYFAYSLRMLTLKALSKMVT